MRTLTANGMLIILLMGGGVLAWRRRPARRILMLAAAAWLGHSLSRAVSPYLYLPTRYVHYPVPLLAALLLPAAATELIAAVLHRRQGLFYRLLSGSAALMVLVLLGSTFGPKTGVNRFVSGSTARMFMAVEELPKDAMIAGWPDGPMDSIPYLCRRQVLLSRELHQAFHTEFVEETRRRMNAISAAYFAVSDDPIRALRKEFGVTHLLVQRSILEGSATGYFAPFDARILLAIERAAGQPYAALTLIPRLAVFQDEHFALLDLRRLDDQ